MKNTKAKGSAKERQSKKLFEAEGWQVTKAGGSLGAADLVCLRAGKVPRLIQVKASTSPWKNFSPPEREELQRVANLCGAIPELAWWGPRARTHMLFDPSEWPKQLPS